MSRKILLTVVFGLIVSSAVQAAPITCTNTTLAALIALGSFNPVTNTGGCESQDKIFSNFQYTPVNLALDPASAINATVVFQAGPSNQDIHGWLFTNNNGTTDAWVFGFTLSYTIQVVPGNPLNVAITASKDQMNAGLDGPTNLVTIQDTQSFAVLNMNALAPGNETQEVTYAPAQLVNTHSVATVPAGGQILSYEQDFFEVTTNSPEPAGLLLLIGGVLTLVPLRMRSWRK
jgi:hypothetical protein